MTPEEIISFVKERRGVYEKKRNDSDPFRDPSYTRHEAFDLTVEAFDIVLWKLTGDSQYAGH